VEPAEHRSLIAIGGCRCQKPGTITLHGQSAQAFADLMRRLRLQLHAKEIQRVEQQR